MSAAPILIYEIVGREAIGCAKRLLMVGVEFLNINADTGFFSCLYRFRRLLAAGASRSDSIARNLMNVGLLSRRGAGLLLLCLCASAARLEAAPRVAGFERFGKTDAAAGQLLLGELGCVACHQTAEPFLLKRQAPNLDDVGARVKASYIKRFLADPQKAKPGTTMPHILVGDAEAGEKIEALTQFLASTGTLKQDTADAKSVQAGRDIFHTIGCVACHGTRDAQGQPETTTAASTPLGDLKAKYSNTSLAAFLSKPHVARPSGRMPMLLLGTDKEKIKDAHDLANYLTQGAKGAKYDDEKISADPAAIAKGKALFASMGCASCHQLKGIASEAKAPALAKLTGVGGCLSDTASKGTPWFDLSAGQKTALLAALKTPALPKEPAQVVSASLLAFNCYACHSRDKIGGPEDELNKSFTTKQPEMGDEARLPPPLDNVGAKINLEYLKQILANGSHDRPYMVTRMPAFGAAASGLPAALAEVDKGKFPPAPEIAGHDSAAKLKSTGRFLVGMNAFSCYKCHTFGGVKAEGVQGIDMTLFPARLQPAWFHAYVGDPQKIRPGTRMPAAFEKGKSPLPNILDGTAAAQIDAMWMYLKDGKSAKLPEGMSKKTGIPLRPIGEAILYRNFITGAGPRAIGVGYPERINLAFDANEVRLALLWQGAFMDAGRHWTGRGEGFEGPLGDNVLQLPAGPDIAALAKSGDPWPKGKGHAKFGGYQLTSDERPTFLYTIGDVKVEDFPNAVVGSKDGGLRRTLSLTATKDVSDLYYRAAVGNKIEAVGNGVYQVDGHLRVKLTSQSTPIIRTNNNKMELLVPVAFTERKARIVQDYNW